MNEIFWEISNTMKNKLILWLVRRTYLNAIVIDEVLKAMTEKEAQMRIDLTWNRR